MLVATIKGGGASYDASFVHPDHLGTPVAATRSDGTLRWRKDYTPFGEERLNDPGVNEEAGFTGHIEGSAIGLTYMQARHYDPIIGRFLSTDPIGYQDQLNLYAYVHNDPVNATDPNGEAAVAIIPAARLAVQACASNAACATAAVAAGAYAAEKARDAIREIAGVFANKSKEGDSSDSVRGTGVRPTDQPVDLPEQLAGEEILGELSEGGGENISEGMGDPRYNPETGTHDKVRGSHEHPDGTVTEVHGDRNRETGELSDTKFKGPPDNNKSRETLYPD